MYMTLMGKKFFKLYLEVLNKYRVCRFTSKEFLKWLMEVHI